MFIDMHALDARQVLETDICILGAGPAGIAVAKGMGDRGIRVCLVESGDLQAHAETQTLADAEMPSHPSHDLKTSRNRQFGGSGNSWSGACAPMSRIDFQSRPWISLDGWPLSREELEPYYERARTMLEIGPCHCETAGLPGHGARFLDLDPDKLEMRIWQLSPKTNFGRAYQEVFRSSPTTTVLLNATATEIVTDEQASVVESVSVQALDGKRASIKARFVVLACGGIDNARMLLLSRQHMPAGLGNGHDLVGRYFMQHPHVSAAAVRFTGSKNWIRGYKDFKHDGRWHRGWIGLSEKTQRQHRVLNPVASLINRFINDTLSHTQAIGYVSLKNVLLGLRRGRIPPNFAFEMMKIARDVKGISSGCLQHLHNRAGALYIMSEQFPNPDSRVTLSEAKDRFGLEKARVDWRLMPIDKRSIRILIQEIQDDFERLGIGEVVPDAWLTVDDHTWPASLAGAHHHMGTTRMGLSPKNSVVDADAKVHGIHNLYIAGSSIFPTVGCANPTLTIVATALKLSDHLIQELH